MIQVLNASFSKLTQLEVRYLWGFCAFSYGITEPFGKRIF